MKRQFKFIGVLCETKNKQVDNHMKQRNFILKFITRTEMTIAATKYKGSTKVKNKKLLNYFNLTELTLFEICANGSCFREV